MDMSAIQNFEPRKISSPMSDSQQQPLLQQHQRQMTQQTTTQPQSIHTSNDPSFTPQLQQQQQEQPQLQRQPDNLVQSLTSDNNKPQLAPTSVPPPPQINPPPRVLEYTPHFGPEGQTFTVTLQSNTDKSLRIGFGTLVVDTKQYAANGYITLSCTVPNFAITKWFVNKVPLYILQMDNDLVQESWPFGDFNYYDALSMTQGNKRPLAEDMMFGGSNNNGNQNQTVAHKRQHLVPSLDLSGITNGQQQQQYQQLSPLPPTTPNSVNGLTPHHDDYHSPLPVTPTSAYDAGLYGNNQAGLQPASPYGSGPSPAYARPGYYGNNQMLAPPMPYTGQQEYAATSAYSMPQSMNHSQPHARPVAPSSYMPQPHPNASMGGMSANSYSPYASLVNKANIKFAGNLDDMAINWSGEEWESQRRLVQFWRRQEGNDIACSFAPVAPADRQPNSIVVSCIYWADKNDCFLTSVDTIYLLESLIAVRFTVEEKNRIRRNLEGFRPLTVSKGKAECAEFFKLIMSFPNPKPRNIEKDVKVFPWKVLPYALKKIISKYTASFSSTASIQTDAFHNANFPHGSTMPLTPKQQSIIESSTLV